MRVLLIDWTKFGHGSATGEIKKSYFAAFEPGSVLHMFSEGLENIGLAIDGDTSKASMFGPHDRALDLACEAFAPDVVLYRPVADRPGFHDAAMRLLRSKDVPLALWMMDDWPERLRLSDAKAFRGMNDALTELFKRSRANFSICEKMSAEYEARYGVRFSVFRNGVKLSDWMSGAKPEKPAGAKVVLRYAGSLAPDMTRNAVRDVAEAVEELSARIPVRMEIHTRPHWYEGEKGVYEKLRSVSVNTKLLNDRDYRAWLMGADIALIGYNFDEQTIRYSQLSFANKTPECLASGAAVLAYGPRQIATIDYLARRGGAVVVDARSPERLKAAIEPLVVDPSARADLVAKARAVAAEDFDLLKQRSRFVAALRAIAPKAGKAPAAAASKSPVAASASTTPAAVVKPAAPATIKPAVGAVSKPSAADPVVVPPAPMPAPTAPVASAQAGSPPKTESKPALAPKPVAAPAPAVSAEPVRVPSSEPTSAPAIEPSAARSIPVAEQVDAASALEPAPPPAGSGNGLYMTAVAAFVMVATAGLLVFGLASRTPNMALVLFLGLATLCLVAGAAASRLLARQSRDLAELRSELKEARSVFARAERRQSTQADEDRAAAGALQAKVIDLQRDAATARAAIESSELRQSKGREEARTATALVRSEVAGLVERLSEETRHRSDAERSIALTMRMRGARLQTLSDSVAALAEDSSDSRSRQAAAARRIASRLDDADKAVARLAKENGADRSEQAEAARRIASRLDDADKALERLSKEIGDERAEQEKAVLQLASRLDQLDEAISRLSPSKSGDRPDQPDAAPSSSVPPVHDEEPAEPVARETKSEQPEGRRIDRRRLRRLERAGKLDTAPQPPILPVLNEEASAPATDVGDQQVESAPVDPMRARDTKRPATPDGSRQSASPPAPTEDVVASLHSEIAEEQPRNQPTNRKRSRNARRR